MVELIIAPGGGPGASCRKVFVNSLLTRKILDELAVDPRVLCNFLLASEPVFRASPGIARYTEPINCEACFGNTPEFYKNTVRRHDSVSNIQSVQLSHDFLAWLVACSRILGTTPSHSTFHTPTDPIHLLNLAKVHHLGNQTMRSSTFNNPLELILRNY